MTRHLGDFQTPASLVDAVLKTLSRRQSHWPRVLEPTCGTGSFIEGAIRNLADQAPAEIIGIELQSDYAARARSISAPKHVQLRIVETNIFSCSLRDLTWKTSGPLLVIGNPPWVTNSEQSSLPFQNLPSKSNFKRLQGMEARTGSSNFDVAEYILLKLIDELRIARPTIALLCKVLVAKNVLKFVAGEGFPFANGTIHRIDAKKSFGAAVDACLFTFDVKAPSDYRVVVYESLNAETPKTTFGVVGGKLVANTEAYARANFHDGQSSLTWRQGVKHDAAQVLELHRMEDGALENNLGEKVQVEAEYVYPLLKSTQLANGEGLRAPTRAILLPQQKYLTRVTELPTVAPRLWDYLQSHREVFRKRKSTIYKDRSDFALFGIGEYSFAAYKVAVSGLHKLVRFRALGPVDDRPIMLDDTCYLTACDSPLQAALIAATLNHPATQELMGSIVFWDTMRPITKSLLQRLDVSAIVHHLGAESLLPLIDLELCTLGESPLERTYSTSDLAGLLQSSSPDDTDRPLVLSL